MAATLYEKAADRLLSVLHKRNETARARISILSLMRSTLPLFTARHELPFRAADCVSTASRDRLPHTRGCI